MRLTRRRLVTTSALSVTLVSTAGCIGDLVQGNGPRVTFSGNVHSEEPILENTGVSVEEPYPHQYARLITSRDDETEEIRWEYVERNLGGLVDELKGTDFDSEFLAFFGLVLPRTKQLQAGSTNIEDGTLHLEYAVGPNTSGSSELILDTGIQRIVHDDPPSDVAVSVTYP